MKKIVFYVLLILCTYSCIEEFDIKDELQDIENALVVEATLTNEFIRQKVILSRTADFEVVNEKDSVYDPIYPILPREPNVIYESNAKVKVVDESGIEYIFNETKPGIYLSDNEFEAQQNTAYTLSIETSDGLRYKSSPEKYESVGQIDQVYAERGLNDVGAEGMFIYVDGGSTELDAKYYRYTYDETFKIIAPSWKREDFVLTNYDPCALPDITYDLEIVFRDDEEGKVCYNTTSSSTIVQNSTLGLQENRIEKLPVRFIDRNNYIISHRYSILVRQYVQSQQAYNYYQSLNNFASSTSVFSEVQPGFLAGNIVVENSSEDNVLGYFEVASVSEERIFFNYDDFFANESLPDYPIPCVPWSPPLEHPSYCFTGELIWPCPLSIVESVNVNLIAYNDLNSQGVGVCPGPYLVTYRACGDCTILGKSAVPEFWTE